VVSLPAYTDGWTDGLLMRRPHTHSLTHSLTHPPLLMYAQTDTRIDARTHSVLRAQSSEHACTHARMHA